jgi:hypothetical protein
MQTMQEHFSQKNPLAPVAGCDSCARGGSWLLRRIAAGGLLLVLAIGLSWAWVARGDGQSAPAAGGEGDSCALFDQDHAAWTAILQPYVHNGSVDYAGLERGGQGELRSYLQSLESVCRGHFDTWTREQKLAFWINAYNAYTVKLILDNYPLSSIRSIGLLPGAAFRLDFIPLQRLRGDELSLNDIEHEILRQEFREPRVHFAIVCASKSCPVLRSEAYRASTLNTQLDDAARAFIRDASKNRLDTSTRTLHLSSIFDWFREDFERAAQSLPRFVARYADTETATAIGSDNVRVEFRDYDWSLNGR